MAAQGDETALVLLRRPDRPDAGLGEVGSPVAESAGVEPVLAQLAPDGPPVVPATGWEAPTATPRAVGLHPLPGMAGAPGFGGLRSLAGVPVGLAAAPDTVGGGDDVTGELRRRLLDAGAAVAVVEPGALLPPGVRCLVDLGALAPGRAPVAAVVAQFERLRRAVERGADEIVLVTGLVGADDVDELRSAGLADSADLVASADLAGSADRAGSAGPGDADPEGSACLVGAAGPAGRGDALAAAGGAAHGLARTFARELPGVRTSVVDVDATAGARAVARAVMAALRHHGPPAGAAAGGPVPFGAAGLLGLTPESVVLVTGGDRGFGAHVARALARCSGCGLEVVGHSPLLAGGQGSDPVVGGDALAVPRAVVRRGELGRPGDVEAERGRILAIGEVRATLAALRRHAAFVEHRSVDLRDGAALRRAVARVRARRGRLDAVVHAVDVRGDGPVRQTAPGAFARVFGARVSPVRPLADAVDPGGVVVLLAGGPTPDGGQRRVATAAADAALAALARRCRGLGARVVAAERGSFVLSLLNG